MCHYVPYVFKVFYVLNKIASLQCLTLPKTNATKPEKSPIK